MDLKLGISILVVINMLLTIVAIGSLIWRLRQNDDQRWASYEKTMGWLGIGVERTPEWERQITLHRMVLVFAIVACCAILVLLGRTALLFMT